MRVRGKSIKFGDTGIKFNRYIAKEIKSPITHEMVKEKTEEFLSKGGRIIKVMDDYDSQNDFYHNLMEEVRSYQDEFRRN
tara:strand:- start:1945 stop:2184 length:240 start_codon:yes stop_codon:yes gene_type:complete